MTDRIDTAKERAEWASIPEWEFPEAMFGLLERYHMALDALDAERALTTRATDGWSTAQIAKIEALLRVGKAEKENERLREALKAIDAAAFNDNGDITYSPSAMRNAFFKARAALNPEGEA